MSIEVKQLSKNFGNQIAVDDIQFSASKGEILGFLGPNGAGKTTMMKMLTCFLKPSSGTATVCGYDIILQSKDVKRQVGYLPEHNPLYKDMYIREYLQTMARLAKVPNPIKKTEELIELTGLGREQNKQIAALSKGFRQRVGLSQALMHDPQVLILDEPTSGLDPNQLLEIRQLIRNFGKEKTLIFSTHIMQEVQALCDRVVIINKGKIVADDPIEILKGKLGDQQIVHLEFANEIDSNLLAKSPNIDKIKIQGKKQFTIYSKQSTDLRDYIYELSIKNNWPIREMTKEKSSVEDVFNELTNDEKN